VRSSHERWDGEGYPDGLSAEEIPLGSRIIFLCDSFDAMTEERPYSRAMPRHEAMAELRRTAGSQFDPELVARFCEMLEEPGRFSGTRSAAMAASNPFDEAAARAAAASSEP
jgi:HD-GYP domain-containing protein (c-di-GMP phosphodiesterase class II)